MLRKLPSLGETVRFKWRNGEAWVEKSGQIYGLIKLSNGRVVGYEVQSGGKKHTILLDLLIRDTYEERKVSSIYS